MPLFAFYLDAVDQALSENTQQTKCDAISRVALLRYSQLQNPAERMQRSGISAQPACRTRQR
jgi:hypothetical protein